MTHDHDGADRRPDLVGAILASLRRQTAMDVVYLGQFVRDVQVIRAVDGDAAPFRLTPGTVIPAGESLCINMVCGRVPRLLPQVSAHPVSRGLEGGRPIEGWTGTPVYLPSGHLYGSMCAASRNPEPGLTSHDLKLFTALAEVLGTHLETEIGTRRDRAATADRIQTILANGGPRMDYQTVVDLRDRRPRGAEALARFDDGPPSLWFTDAEAVGLHHDLELAAVTNGLRALEQLPDEQWVAVNVSPATIATGLLERRLAPFPPHRVVIELTEHAAVYDYTVLREELAPLRDAGVRLAIDDAGAGFSSFRHVLSLRPDIIKLDVSLTNGVATDPMQRALAASLADFARQVGATVVGEGIEDGETIAALCDLGISLGQGYLLARPAALQPSAGRATP